MSMKPKSNARDSERTSRRRFAKSIAATLVAATPLAARLAEAQTPATPKEPTAPPATPQPTPAPQELSPVAAAYAEVARARFGDKLSPEQLEQVRKDLNNYVTTSDRLRAVKLKNGDEPDFIFSP
jgi:hypothetical protein